MVFAWIDIKATSIAVRNANDIILGLMDFVLFIKHKILCFITKTFLFFITKKYKWLTEKKGRIRFSSTKRMNQKKRLTTIIHSITISPKVIIIISICFHTSQIII